MKVNLINENWQQDYLKNLLAARGIDDLELYLNPPATVLNDPHNLTNIEKGINLLQNTL